MTTEEEAIAEYKWARNYHDKMAALAMISSTLLIVAIISLASSFFAHTSYLYAILFFATSFGIVFIYSIRFRDRDLEALAILNSYAPLAGDS